MGAPQAPPWDTIFFGIHKETVLTQFRDKLQLYCCFIENILGIWLVNPNPAEDHRQWTLLVALMQDYYGLDWIFEKRPKKGKLYGHDNHNPQGLDHHVAL